MKKRQRRKIPVVIHAGVTIREVRPGYWMTDIMRAGKRERECFRDLAVAKTHAEASAIQVKNQGLAALTLTLDQRRDAAAALAVLHGRAKLVDAVRFWALHHPEGEFVTLEKLADGFLADLRARNARPSTLAEREHKFTRLTNDLGAKPAAAVEEADLTGWMDGKGLAGETRDGYRRAFHALFQWGFKRKTVTVNPCALIPRILSDEASPEFFAAAATAKILAAAVAHQPRIVPYLALQFFGGLRPGEAAALDWQDVHLDAKELTINSATSKRRRRRIVKINPTLAAWLRPYALDAGRIGRDTREQTAYAIRAVAKAAGVPWIQDGPRHTFGTMSFAVNPDINTLAAEMGNSPEIIHRHYRGLAKAKDARKFWKIRPISVTRGAAPAVTAAHAEAGA